MKTKDFDNKFKRAADLVKWKRIPILMAAAVVTNDPKEAVEIINKLKESF